MKDHLTVRKYMQVLQSERGGSDTSLLGALLKAQDAVQPEFLHVTTG